MQTLSSVENDNTPHFFIVTPCLNAAEWINSAIASVVTQEGEFCIHYHVQDGGSKDDTVEHLASWERLLGTPNPLVRCRRLRFTWASEADGGMYDAINKGFKKLEVPPEGIMAWVNADDAYLPHAFATAAHVFGNLPQLQWMGGALHVAQNGILHTASNSLQPYPIELIRNYCCDATCWEHLHQAAMFWKGQLWHQTGGLNASLRFAGDYELWPRFAQRAPFVHLAVPLCVYRDRAEQLSRHDGYVAEKESIVPSATRYARIRAFWRRRVQPPLAPSLRWNGSNFEIALRRAWPRWGKGTAFYQRRLWYESRQAFLFLQNILTFYKLCLGRKGSA